MAFISNASDFTLGDGVYTNVQGNIVHHHNNFYGTKRRRDGIEGGSDVLLLTDRSEQHRRSEEGAGNGIKVIRQKNLQLIRQIGSGPGYLLHAGRNKSRAVTVKVFNGSNSMAQQQLDLEVTLLKGVIHPNVPRIQGVSSSTSVTHFIAYEDVCGRNAKGPLADALQNRTRSIRLGLKMVADLSAGLGYLSTQSTSLGGMKVENFDVFLDVRDRFLLIINPNSPDEAHANSQSSQDERTWALFNGLCDKVLLSANRVLHTEEIDRDPVLLPLISPASQKSDSFSVSIGLSTSQDEQEDAGAGAASSAGDPRREYVWRAMDRGKHSLATVTEHMTTHLDLTLRLQTLTQTDGRRPHRCRGYIREEITLAPTIADSAVVSHDTPSPLEICSICHEVVNPLENFRCVCGLDPGSRPGYTVKCNMCKFWSHGECLGHFKSDFTCRLCERLSTSFRYPGVEFYYWELEASASEGDEYMSAYPHTDAQEFAVSDLDHSYMNPMLRQASAPSMIGLNNPAFMQPQQAGPPRQSLEGTSPYMNPILRQASAPSMIGLNNPAFWQPQQAGPLRQSLEGTSRSQSSDSQSGMADNEEAEGMGPYSETPPPPTPHQSAVLHALLAQSRFPTAAMREEVGRSIALSAQEVQIRKYVIAFLSY